MQNRKLDEAFTLRLPEGWRARIKREAVRNHRSMNQEIVAALEGIVRKADHVASGPNLED